MTISLNLGKGLKFQDHKIVTDLSPFDEEDNELIKVLDDGLYVSDLSGASGGIGGSSPDGVTITESPKGKLKLNVDYVQLIYSMGYRVVSDRSSANLKYSDTLKTLNDIVTEMNRCSSANYTSYYFRKGDLFQLVSYTNGSRPNTSYSYMEDCNRYISCVGEEENNETKVLFVVDSASYSGRKCTQLTLTCLYVKEGEASNFVPKQIYTYPS